MSTLEGTCHLQEQSPGPFLPYLYCLAYRNILLFVHFKSQISCVMKSGVITYTGGSFLSVSTVFPVTAQENPGKSSRLANPQRKARVGRSGGRERKVYSGDGVPAGPP